MRVTEAISVLFNVWAARHNSAMSRSVRSDWGAGIGKPDRPRCRGWSGFARGIKPPRGR